MTSDVGWDEWLVDYDQTPDWVEYESDRLDGGSSYYDVSDDPYLEDVSGCYGCGDSVGEKVVLWPEVEKHDARVRNLATDASQQQAKTPQWAAWATDWGLYLVDWRTWYTQALANSRKIGLPDAVFGDEHVAEYDAYVARYNELLRRFLEAGGKTSAAPGEPPVPPWEKYAKWGAGAALLLGAAYLVGSSAALVSAVRGRA